MFKFTALFLALLLSVSCFATPMPIVDAPKVGDHLRALGENNGYMVSIDMNSITWNELTVNYLDANINTSKTPDANQPLMFGERIEIDCHASMFRFIDGFDVPHSGKPEASIIKDHNWKPIYAYTVIGVEELYLCGHQPPSQET